MLAAVPQISKYPISKISLYRNIEGETNQNGVVLPTWKPPRVATGYTQLPNNTKSIFKKEKINKKEKENGWDVRSIGYTLSLKVSLSTVRLRL